MTSKCNEEQRAGKDV